MDAALFDMEMEDISLCKNTEHALTAAHNGIFHGFVNSAFVN